ncbi:type II secretion system protein GspM [Tenebrionibacter intestinalis]|jgi:type II secretory pathway component PulM|uniref:Type II secretion system protein M n=1 Tax=Tenebrionibacter intestinalis TaxID=2799638 RepID=A0A8K0V3D6_9ENTR|nr:type II secretion system protein GspM [Tenebrionibacter intestinalis]MBK4716096.1 type II secretion system protein M [Tenebrionibacter intestinalis]
MKSVIRDIWRRRTARERGLLAALAMMFAALMLWQGIWRPLHRALELQEQRRLQLTTQARQLTRLPARTKGALVARELQEDAARRGIVLKTLNAQTGQLRVGIASTNADALLTWLLTLEAQGAAEVLTLEMQGNTPSDGNVRADILLEPR